jgi:hypothetical protein
MEIQTVESNKKKISQISQGENLGILLGPSHVCKFVMNHCLPFFAKRLGN